MNTKLPDPLDISDITATLGTRAKGETAVWSVPPCSFANSLCVRVGALTCWTFRVSKYSVLVQSVQEVGTGVTSLAQKLCDLLSSVHLEDQKAVSTSEKWSVSGEVIPVLSLKSWAFPVCESRYVSASATPYLWLNHEASHSEGSDADQKWGCKASTLLFPQQLLMPLFMKTCTAQNPVSPVVRQTFTQFLPLIVQGPLGLEHGPNPSCRSPRCRNLAPKSRRAGSNAHQRRQLPLPRFPISTAVPRPCI
jgi:hypothetical protein